MFCKNCGKKIDDDSRFCQHCGTQLNILGDNSNYKGVLKTDELLIPYLKNSKYGYCDSKKDIKIKCVYDYAQLFKEDYASVKLNRKWGIINKQGEIILDCIYEDEPFYLNSIGWKVKLEGKVGIVNNGVSVIQCLYNYILNFNNGIAVASLNWKAGVIDINGKVIIPFIYKKIDGFGSSNASQVEIDGKYGMIDITGKIIIPIIYDSLSNLGKIFIAKLNEKYGLIDKDSNVIVPFSYDTMEFYRQDYIVVSQNKKYGVINLNGVVSYELIYDSSSDIKNALKKLDPEYIKQVSNENIDNYAFKIFGTDGYCATKLNGKYGIVDKNGKEIVANIFDSVDFDSNGYNQGLLSVQLDGWWGYIDINGKIVIECEYYEAWDFDKGLACVEDVDGWGFIDTTGKVIIDCIYDEGTWFKDDIAEVTHNGLVGLIDRTGRVIAPCKYDYIGDLNKDGIAKVAFGTDHDNLEEDGDATEAYIDKNGVEYWDLD